MPAARRAEARAPAGRGAAAGRQRARERRFDALRRYKTKSQNLRALPATVMAAPEAVDAWQSVPRVRPPRSLFDSPAPAGDVDAAFATPPPRRRRAQPPGSARVRATPGHALLRLSYCLGAARVNVKAPRRSTLIARPARLLNARRAGCTSCLRFQTMSPRWRTRHVRRVGRKQRNARTTADVYSLACARRAALRPGRDCAAAAPSSSAAPAAWARRRRDGCAPSAGSPAAHVFARQTPGANAKQPRAGEPPH